MLTAADLREIDDSGYVETSGRFAAKLRAFEGEVHPEGMDHADEVLVPRTHCLLVEVAGNAGRSAADAVDGARLTAPVAMSSSAVTVGAELFADKALGLDQILCASTASVMPAERMDIAESRHWRTPISPITSRRL